MSATKLKVWLPFDESATADKCGNSWTTYGTVSIGDTNAISGQALQPNKGYLRSNDAVTFGGQDFTVDFYGYINSSSENWVAPFSAVASTSTSSRTGLISLRRNSSGSNFDTEIYNQSGSSLGSASISNLTNARHHFEFDYSHDDSKFRIFIDGELKITQTLSLERLARYIFIGTNSYTPSSKRMVGSIDEFRIYDGVALHAENFTPPTAEDYDALAFILDSQIDFTVDVQRKLSNVVEFTADVQRTIKTKWRYINLGTIDTLYGEEGFISGSTLENLDESQSKTGTAFYQTTRAKCFDVPATDEIWIKFDVYFDGENRWRAYNGGTNGATGICSYANGSMTFWVNDGDKGNFTDVCKTNQLQTVLLHMVSGSSAGVVEAWVDGTKIYTYTGDVNHGEDFCDFYLQSDGSGTFFSNVIISNAEIGLGDGYQKFAVDVQRIISKRFEFTADVQRKVNNSFTAEFSADVVIRDVLPVTFAADIERRVTRPMDFTADVEILDTIPFEFAADINRAIKGKIKLFAIDTSEYFSGGTRGLKKLLRDSSDELTPVVIPPQETIPAAPDNTIGLQSIEISLSEQQLTDNVNFVGVVPFDIMFPIQGQYLDYVFDMRVERVQQKGILYSCECCSDADALLYTQIAYTIPKSTEWSSSGSSSSDTTSKDESVAATYHANGLARTIGKTAVIQFDDFQSTVLMENLGGVTYADMIRDVFGWSSRVPTHMINVFIRDDKIYFVQRGHEARLIDISESKHTVPTVTHELVRMTWGSTPWSKTETREIKSYQPPSSSSSSTSGDNTGTGGDDTGTGDNTGTGGDDTGTGDNPSGTSGGTGTGGTGSGTGTGTGDDNPDNPDDGDGNDDDDDDDDDNDKNNRWSNVGKVTTKDLGGTTRTTYHYDRNGVLQSTYAVYTSYTDSKENHRTSTKHSYTKDGLISKTRTKVRYSQDPQSNTKTVTTFGYLTLIDGKKFLSTESTIVYDYGGQIIDKKVTIKKPTGGGQGSSGDNNGGSDGSGNIGDDRVTPYQRQQTSQTKEAAYKNATSDYNSKWNKVLNDYLSSTDNPDPDEIAALKKSFDESFNSAFRSDHESNYYTETQSRTLNGLSLYDSSFPIHNTSKLIELTAAIKWLNRRTKETVTFTLYEYPHLIDFNDRIIFNGAQYFLVSNIATTNARIFNEQRISIVRWY